MQFIIQRADGLYFKASNIFNPWTPDEELATQYNTEDAMLTARDLRKAAKRADVPQDIKVVQSALQLAQVFSRELKDELYAEEMAEVIARNRTETSPNVCHSHDFCDANMTMQRALAKLLGIRVDRVSVSRHADLMGTAQDIAFNHRFFTN